MDLSNCLAHLNEGSSCCLHNQKPFASFFHVALPAVNGDYLGNDINASGEAVFYEMARDLLSFLFRSGSGEDDSFVGHIKSTVNYQRPCRHLTCDH